MSGENGVTVLIQDGQVRIQFRRPLEWVAMDAPAAMKLAALLIHQAQGLALSEGVVLEVPKLERLQ